MKLKPSWMVAVNASISEDDDIGILAEINQLGKRKGPERAMKSKPSHLSATAHHEAGHALADYMLGFKIKMVTIVPGDDFHGMAKSNIGLKLKVSEYSALTSATRARWHDKVVSLLAGEEAQRKFNPRSVRSYHGNSDRKNTIDLLERLHDGDELRAAYRYLKIRARNLISTKRNWSMIQDLAQALLKRQTMTGPEVIAEFKASLDRQMSEAMKRGKDSGSSGPVNASPR